MKYLISSHGRCALALVLCVAGCGDDDDDEPTLSSQQAQDAVTAVNDAVQGGLLEFSQMPDRSDGFDFRCPGGGSAHFDGNLDLEVTPVWVDLDVDVIFDDCSSGTGLVLSGAVQLTEEVQVGGEEVVRVASRLEGEVEVTGAIEGACRLDLSVEVDLTPEQRGEPWIKATGLACGYDGDLYNDLEPAPIWELQ